MKKELKQERILDSVERIYADIFLIFWITDPPQIVEKLKDQRVKAGSPATFYCRVTGDPPPTIHWRKNGKKQPGGHTRIFIENFPGVSMLRINPARHVRDDASYECMAENGVGDPVTASANLTVFSGMSSLFFLVQFFPTQLSLTLCIVSPIIHFTKP